MADKNGAASPIESSAKRQKTDDAPQKTTLKEFEAVFPKLEADLAEHAQKYNLPKEELEWYKAVSVSLVAPDRSAPIEIKHAMRTTKVRQVLALLTAIRHTELACECCRRQM